MPVLFARPQLRCLILWSGNLCPFSSFLGLSVLEADINHKQDNTNNPLFGAHSIVNESTPPPTRGPWVREHDEGWKVLLGEPGGLVSLEPTARRLLVRRTLTLPRRGGRKLLQ